MVHETPEGTHTRKLGWVGQPAGHKRAGKLTRGRRPHTCVVAQSRARNPFRSRRLARGRGEKLHVAARRHTLLRPSVLSRDREERCNTGRARLKDVDARGDPPASASDPRVENPPLINQDAPRLILMECHMVAATPA